MNAKLKDLFWVLVGNSINAFAVAFFILPNDLSMGGEQEYRL